MKPLVPWVHRATDGRGPREVYLNGELIGRVLFADERRGYVRVHAPAPGEPQAYQVLRGKVEVKMIGGGGGGPGQ